MKSSLEKQIYLCCPIIFRSHGNTTRNRPLFYGMECGDGWYRLIRELAVSVEEIALALKNSGIQQSALPIVVQIKEKFGGLHFYVEHATPEINALITKAESNSFDICEICGKPGTKFNELSTRTRCELCKNTHSKLGAF